jgi:betaine-aldehyde dehydrogenase
MRHFANCAGRIPRAKRFARVAAARKHTIVCETLSDEASPSRGKYFNITVHEPVGVVAAITPWNSPLTMAAQKLAPALAAGNAVILKPAEHTSIVTLELGRLCTEAGLPVGLLSVLPGGTEVGRQLVENSDINLISFTGGTETGRTIAGVAARRLVPTILELGGKSPNIVFADADLNTAARAVAKGIFEGSGQSCVAGSRLFVENKIADRFRELLLTATRELTVGNPQSDHTRIGPLVSKEHRARIERYMALAKSEGGRILFGGERPGTPELAKGFYFLPTIVDGLDNAAQTVQEEIFGPVLCCMPFENEDELIEQANDSVYGLACGIWTSDYARAWRIARAVQAGTVWINTYKELSIANPFGGFKQSGIGREKGIEGLRSYQLSKSILFGI